MRSGFVLLIIACLAASCKTEPSRLLEAIDPGVSKVNFSNVLKEDNDFNIIEYLYFYNGAGVSIGDINNDGLPDIYLVSNQNSNKLFLNKGNFEFEDITDKARVGCDGNWKTGTTMADVNGDGWLDIYVCEVGGYKKFNGSNRLFINNGNLTFTESSEQCGLGFQGLSTQSAFFDYDRDGDLDMYLLNHSVHSVHNYGNASLRNQVDSLAGDKLFRNEMIPSGKLTFTDVTKSANIYSSAIGYGLGIGISDLNNDGYPDLYVSNDFHENDYLYLNQKNGTFREVSEKSFAHTSRFSMGNDIADFNNDLRPDVITTDMLPRDETIIKTSAGEDPYEIYAFKLKQGFHRQVSRNALQVNRGMIDSVPFFSDIAFMAGVEATDWSWSPLLADIDGDGWKDLMVTNGILRRPNNLDYINFISADSIQKRLVSSNNAVRNLIERMPEGQVANFVFRNSGNGHFEDKSSQWMVPDIGSSNGLGAGDLDGDGDLDFVINNLNKAATLLRNNAVENKSGHFLTVVLQGGQKNTKAIGAIVQVYSKGIRQLQELNPSRGWCSSSDYKMSFGLPTHQLPDSVIVVWPTGGTTIDKKISSSSLVLKYSDAKVVERKLQTTNKPFISRIDIKGFKHRENGFNAFTRENLLPAMATTEGPPLEVSDLNGDGRDDFFIGGGKGQASALFLQTQAGDFVKANQKALAVDSAAEDVAAAFFDADGDHDQDLIVAGGGQEIMEKSALLQPRLYLNDGQGNLSKSGSFPEIFLNASCIRPFDYDRDGDVDLFMGSDVMPLLYGMAPVSYLLQNEGGGNFVVNPYWLGRSTFDNFTRSRPGMVKDAVWADINNDPLIDLVLVGEWMPVTILIQQRDNTFLNLTNEYGLAHSRGWWNTVSAADIDNDGDTDIIGGNLGLNSRLKTSFERPVQMVLGDFDSNGSSDHILMYYNGDKRYPFISRDQLVKQLPHLKKKFLQYDNYKNATLDDIVSGQDRQRSATLTADVFASSVFVNNVNSFIQKTLPDEIQISSVQTILVHDVNGDGNEDIIAAGNFSATQPEYGAYDAGIGTILLGDGQGTFKPLDPIFSGFVVPGEARSMAWIKKSRGKSAILISRNNDTVLQYEIDKKPEPLP